MSSMLLRERLLPDLSSHATKFYERNLALKSSFYGIRQHNIRLPFGKAKKATAVKRGTEINCMLFRGKSILFSLTSLYNFHFLGITYSSHILLPLSHFFILFNFCTEPYSASWLWFLLSPLSEVDVVVFVNVCKFYDHHPRFHIHIFSSIVIFPLIMWRLGKTRSSITMNEIEIQNILCKQIFLNFIYGTQSR